MTCPLCGHEFEAEMDMSGTQFGVRLDLKPLGPTAAPWRVAVCPRCHFVLFKDDMSDTEKKTLTGYVGSDEYKHLVAEGHSSYFLLAALIKHMKQRPFDVAYACLQASWQVESESPARYRAYIQEALGNLRASLDDKGVTDKDDHRTVLVLIGEVLRQVAHFDEARKHFESLAGEPAFKQQPYRTIVQYELDLIAAKDSSPKERPEIVLTQADKMTLPEYQMCYGLAGIDVVTNSFTVYSADLGHINSLPYSLNVILDPDGRNTRLVNTAWWFDPVDEKSKTAAYDWLAFMKCYEEVNSIASKHKWLAAWRDAGTNRTVQACIFGVRPYTETMLEELVVPGWKHAGMKGTPEYEIKLRRAGQWCGTIFLSKDDPRAFVETMHSGDGRHWLDRHDISYHPTQEIPEYILVEPNGEWSRNTRRKNAIPTKPSTATE